MIIVSVRVLYVGFSISLVFGFRVFRLVFGFWFLGFWVFGFSGFRVFRFSGFQVLGFQVSGFQVSGFQVSGFQVFRTGRDGTRSSTKAHISERSENSEKLKKLDPIIFQF